MSRPWFPFYVGDYVRDTARLTTEAHGAYLLLMLDYWVNGAPPDDDETLATITKLPVTIWRKRRPMLVKFFKVKDGLWTHNRIEKERAKAEGVGASNSDKAREAAERRWAKDRARKLQECSDGAPSIDQALLHNAQSQPQSPSKSISKSESALSSLDSRSEKDQPKAIDDSYQPSDAAIEYAYSLGMKKADLNSELSKFAADGMAKRAVSFDLDASFKKRCDQWFDYKRKNAKPEPVSAAPFVPTDDDWDKAVKTWSRNESHWPRWAGNSPTGGGSRCPAAVLLANGIDPDSGMQTAALFFLEVGTAELNAHLHDRQARKAKPPNIRTIMVGGVEKTGAYFKHKVPPGYDEATGEKLPPASEEDENAA